MRRPLHPTRGGRLDALAALSGAAAVVVLLAVSCRAPGQGTAGLHVSASNVGWHDDGGGWWHKVGGRADLDCRTPRLRIHAPEFGSGLAPPPASAVCRTLTADPGLFRAATRPPRCSGYWDGIVRVEGVWHGRRQRLRFETCNWDGHGPAPDPGARWVRLLGFRFVGPDPPG